MPALLINNEIYGDTPSKEKWNLLGSISGIDNFLELPESFDELYVEARDTVEESNYQTTMSLSIPKIALNNLGKDFVIGGKGAETVHSYCTMFRATNAKIAIHTMSIGGENCITDTATMTVYYK